MQRGGGAGSVWPRWRVRREAGSHKIGNEGSVKLVEDADPRCPGWRHRRRPNGGEVPGALAVAGHARVPTATLCEMIYAGPTLHRAIEVAPHDLGSPHGQADT